jgi:hypothetical protein
MFMIRQRDNGKKNKNKATLDKRTKTGDTGKKSKNKEMPERRLCGLYRV